MIITWSLLCRTLFSIEQWVIYFTGPPKDLRKVIDEYGSDLPPEGLKRRLLSSRSRTGGCRCTKKGKDTLWAWHPGLLRWRLAGIQGRKMNEAHRQLFSNTELPSEEERSFRCQFRLEASYVCDFFCVIHLNGDEKDNYRITKVSP